MSTKRFELKLKRSLIGCTVTQKETARCLGLRKTNSTAIVADNAANRGQILKIQHLLDVSVKKFRE